MIPAELRDQLKCERLGLRDTRGEGCNSFKWQTLPKRAQALWSWYATLRKAAGAGSTLSDAEGGQTMHNHIGRSPFSVPDDDSVLFMF